LDIGRFAARWNYETARSFYLVALSFAKPLRTFAGNALVIA
jgi:hypothetical protein